MVFFPKKEKVSANSTTEGIAKRMLNVGIFILKNYVFKVPLVQKFNVGEDILKTANISWRKGHANLTNYVLISTQKKILLK